MFPYKSWAGIMIPKGHEIIDYRIEMDKKGRVQTLSLHLYPPIANMATGGHILKHLIYQISYSAEKKNHPHTHKRKVVYM